jgi:capsular exopolysaccharide synthesis family protein
MSTRLITEPTEIHPKRSLNGEFAAYYQTILSRLCWPHGFDASLLRTLGITSCFRGEGVSTVAAHLSATAAAGSGQRVLLVDANVAQPSAHKTFSVALEPGLSDVLLDPERLPAAVHATAVAGLSILPAGGDSRTPGENCGESALADALEALRTAFDLLVFDLPPATLLNFPSSLASMLDGVLWIVQAQRVPLEAALRTKELLAKMHVQLLGTVLNKSPRHLPRWLNGET